MNNSDDFNTFESAAKSASDFDRDFTENVERTFLLHEKDIVNTSVDINPDTIETSETYDSRENKARSANDRHALAQIAHERGVHPRRRLVKGVESTFNAGPNNKITFNYLKLEEDGTPLRVTAEVEAGFKTLRAVFNAIKNPHASSLDENQYFFTLSKVNLGDEEIMRTEFNNTNIVDENGKQSVQQVLNDMNRALHTKVDGPRIQLQTGISDFVDQIKREINSNENEDDAA